MFNKIIARIKLASAKLNHYKEILFPKDPEYTAKPKIKSSIYRDSYCDFDIDEDINYDVEEVPNMPPPKSSPELNNIPKPIRPRVGPKRIDE
jgi:hypothetical protein